jgi:Kef-type K+ transport system membrane component KefB
MTEIMTLLIMAAIGYGVAKALGVPVLPFLILAGVGLNASGLLAEAELVQQVLVLGLAFLVFAAGMELNPMRFGRLGHAAISVGTSQFFTLGAIGLGIGLLLGLPWIASIYVALAVAASSTIVVLRILRQRRQFFEPFGRLVLGVLLVQDVLIILSIAGLSRAEDGVLWIGHSLISTLLLVALAWAFVKWISPLLLLRMKLDQEALLLTALAILFLFAGIGHLLGLHLVVGAFLAGVALSGFPVNGVIRGQMTSLSDFFLAMFFVALGASLTIPNWNELAIIVALSALVVLLTPPLVLIVARRMGLSARASIESGLLLAQCSEFSIIVAVIGVGIGHISEGMMSIIAAMTVITMILTPFIATDQLTWRLVRLLPMSGEEPSRKKPSDHILLLGCGANSMVLLDLLLLHGKDVLVVDEDPGVVEKLRERGVEAIRGDGADEQVLEAVGARDASMVISNMRRVDDNARMLQYLGRSEKQGRLIRVFDEHDAERIRKIGATPILDSEAAGDEFLRWFDQRFAAGRS